MVNPHRIKYNNIFSNELNVPDLITCVAFDGDDGESPSFLNRESVASESYDGRYKRIHRLKYTDTFAPRITFMKSDFQDFSIEEVRAVLKWLTSKDTTALLEAYYDDSNVVTWASIGGFVDLQTYKLANNRTVAITATWDSISPFCFSDLNVIKKTPSATDNKITINIDTDDNQVIYPKVTIKQTGGLIHIPAGTVYNLNTDMIQNAVYYNGTKYYWKSNISSLVVGKTEPDYGWEKITRETAYKTTDEIKERTVYYYTSDQKYRWIEPHVFKESDSNPNFDTTGVKIVNKYYDIFGKLSGVSTMILKNNTTTEQIVVDGANKVISSTNTRRIFGDDFVNWSWLPLHDGKNEITIEGNCEVTLEYRTVIKCGEY